MTSKDIQQSDYCPRLIEVALPIREISAESVRDKSLRHGHISTLHLWWARRPLPASRAVVFASLVPDPDDPRCPEEFRHAVEKHLKTNVPSELKYYRRGRDVHRDEDPYHPYHGIPDTLRNRLLTFIGKWSPEALAFETGKSMKEPKPAELLNDRSLVKWETSDPDNPQGQEVLRIAGELVRSAHGGKTPTVLDPFAGGGAIPLEAGRLGCQAIANDYNPVAYLILRATCEFPQKYGKPGRRKVIVEDFGKKVEREIEVPNVLAHDVEKWAKWILDQARERIGHLYPPGKDGYPVVGYLWARTVPCSNPSCRSIIPLFRSVTLCSKVNKKAAMQIKVQKAKKELRVGIVKGENVTDVGGTMIKGGDCRCPFCDQVTSVKAIREAGQEEKLGERMMAVIINTPNGKDYRPVEDSDLYAYAEAEQMSQHVERPSEYIVPEINAPGASGDAGSHRSISTELYGLKQFGQFFNSRQIVAMQTFNDTFKDLQSEFQKINYSVEYSEAISTILGLWISRISMFTCNIGIWYAEGELIKNPFGRQAIAMVWDYPESDPFSDSTGGALIQLSYILRVLEHESPLPHTESNNISVLNNDAASLPISPGIVDAAITDPPYFDAVAYADLSDFFYVWLKRSVGNLYPQSFTTPLTPKSEEAVAHKHRHHGNKQKGKEHFQLKITESFREAKRITQPNSVITVMFAHQSTEAWSALIDSLFKAGLTVTATYPIDTELTTALKRNVSALASSITVVCRSRELGTATSFRDARREIEHAVAESVHRFWGYGFRGADLIVACYGPAVGVFGKYERVEKADGSPVEIPELLELARIAARDAIAGEFRGDNLSTLYYVWANLYGAAEQAWDDARLVVQIGGDAESAMEVARGHGIFVVDGSKCRLALLGDREKRRGLGIDPNPPLIDTLHRSMLLWREEKRPELVRYLGERELLEDGPFWKLAQALFEVLPRDIEDWKLINALLGERETLRVEGKRAVDSKLPLFGLQR